jgi:hypothetical protein
MTHIVACVPFARDYVYRKFLISWTNMIFYARGKYDLSMTTTYGPYIDINRDWLVESAKDMSADYLLFLDDDQTYPPNTPEKLLNNQKPMVGGITPMKDTAGPMVWDYDYEKSEIVLWENLDGKKGLVKVGGMGMGGVLIDMLIFDKLKKPYFKIPNDSKEHGEDIAFYLWASYDTGDKTWRHPTLLMA